MEHKEKLQMKIDWMPYHHEFALELQLNQLKASAHGSASKPAWALAWTLHWSFQQSDQTLREQTKESFQALADCQEWICACDPGAALQDIRQESLQASLHWSFQPSDETVQRLRLSVEEAFQALTCHDQKRICACYPWEAFWRVAHGLLHVFKMYCLPVSGENAFLDASLAGVVVLSAAESFLETKWRRR